MGIRTTSSEQVVALFDSGTGWAFGPVFDSEYAAEDFLDYTATGSDLRGLTDPELKRLHAKWLRGWRAEHGD